MTVAPIDLNAAWDAHRIDVLADREPSRISGSDLHGCDRALWTRYAGEPQLPYDNASFSSFERGHAYENRIWDAVKAYAATLEGFSVVRSADTLTFDGVEGHPDFLLFKDKKLVAVIDPTTTASKFSDWKYPHALKSAYYAVALGCETFCEWTFCIGFGGNILKNEPHWFSLDEAPYADGVTWRERVMASIAHAKAVVALAAAPAPIPPTDPTDGSSELWRCQKGYCRSVCPANKRLSPMSGAA